MRFLPVFLDTAAGVVVVVGSGEPALGKLRLLRAAGAHVRWFSRDADVAEEMLPPSAQGRLEISFGDPLKVAQGNASLDQTTLALAVAGITFDRDLRFLG